MTTAPAAMARFEHEGIFDASPTLIARRLREQNPDLWPPGGAGGSHAAALILPSHLCAFVLAQAAHLPSDAGAVAAALHPLVFLEQDVAHETRPERFTVPTGAVAGFGEIGEPGQTLGDVLDGTIDFMGDPGNRRVIGELTATDWTLTLCADPGAPWATITYRYYNEIRTNIFGQRPEMARVQRTVRLPWRVMEIAGELWEHSRAVRSGTDPLPGGPAPSTAPTTQQRQAPKQVDATARARAPATSGGTDAKQRRRPRSLTNPARGTA